MATRVLAADAASPGAAKLDGRMVDARSCCRPNASWRASRTDPFSLIPPETHHGNRPSSTQESFQGIFTSDAMRQVWSDENRNRKYVDIERALAKVQGHLGLIPQEAADEIISHCHLDQIDMVKLRRRPNASAIRFSASSRRSMRCVETSWASMSTGRDDAGHH